MIINTRQKHQLSDLSLRLSLPDGQNVENVTKHRLLGLIHCRQQIPMASQDRTHTQKYVQKTHLFLLSQLQHIIKSHTRKLFYNAHIKPPIDYPSVVWDGRGEFHLKKTELPTAKGRQINPSWSFPICRAKAECAWNFKPTATARLQ